MRKPLVLYCFCIILFGLSACKSGNADESKVQTPAQVENHSEVQYEIEKVIWTTSDERITIEYPQLTSPVEDYENLNSLIQNDVTTWVNETCAADAIVNLNCSITSHDNSYISVLFEGQINAPNAAHPLNVVHSVCVSISDGILIDPLNSIEINDVFVDNFKYFLRGSEEINQFSDEQWDQVVAYIEGFSYEEIRQMIACGECVLVEDGILICISVPHPIGDYIKVIVKTAFDEDDFSSLVVGESTLEDVLAVAPASSFISVSAYDARLMYPHKDGGYIYVSFNYEGMTLIVADIHVSH